MADKFRAMPSISEVVGELHALTGEFHVSRIDNATRLGNILTTIGDIRNLRQVSEAEAELWMKVSEQLEQITSEELRVTDDFHATVKRICAGLELQTTFLLELQSAFVAVGKPENAAKLSAFFVHPKKGKKK